MSRSHDVVRELMAARPTVKRSGFKKAISGVVGDIKRLVKEEELPPEFFIPDAFEVNPMAQRITIYEVVDTNPISAGKAFLIYELADLLDEYDWELTVTTLDYAGNKIADVPAWCYMPALTNGFAKGIGRDMTPAARSVMEACGAEQSPAASALPVA